MNNKFSFQTTRETYLPGHIWLRLSLLGTTMFVVACILAGSVSFVTLRIVQRSSASVAGANVLSLIVAGVLIGAFQATVGDSLVGKFTGIRHARSTAWHVGTVLLTLLGLAISVGPLLAQVDIPVFSWVYANTGFIVLIIAPALFVGVFQGVLIRNGWRGLGMWLALVLISWLLAAKLIERLFFFLIGY